MKKLLAFLLLFGMVACTEKQPEEIIGETTPLKVTLNSSSLCMGETLIVTVSVDDSKEGEELHRNDFQLYFEALESGTYTDLFSDFSPEITFPCDQDEITVEFPVRDSGIKGEHTVLLWVSAAGRAIEGASRTITVSDYHYVSVSVKDSESGDVTEGGTFVLKASVSEPAPADLKITIVPESGVESDFVNLPSAITILKGQKSAESEAVTVSRDDGGKYDDRIWNFTAKVDNGKYAVRSFSLTRIDCDAQKGDRLLDERWVYDNPDAPFYSELTKDSYLKCPSYREDGVLMTKSATAGEGDPHPNRLLAAEGWTLLNAVEFHAIDGWSLSRSAKNNYGINPVAVANGWAEQSTVKVEMNCFIDNSKYTNVTDEGYLRMWSCKDNGSAKSGGGARYFGSAALYANKAANSIAKNTAITEGTRVEVRARLRGKLQGFNYAIWLQGNNQVLEWPKYGEIDIMENPVSVTDVAGTSNTVHQTLHWGEVIDGKHANPTVNKQIDASEWNIYWLEIVDATTVKLGINGVTTKVFTASDNNTSNSYEWPFCNAFNPQGFHILLTPGVASDWAGSQNNMNQAQINAGEWADPAFRTMTYEESKTSDIAPRMEIDWIRYWKNSNYSDLNFGVNGNAKMF